MCWFYCFLFCAFFFFWIWILIVLVNTHCVCCDTLPKSRKSSSVEGLGSFTCLDTSQQTSCSFVAPLFFFSFPLNKQKYFYPLHGLFQRLFFLSAHSLLFFYVAERIKVQSLLWGLMSAASWVFLISANTCTSLWSLVQAAQWTEVAGLRCMSLMWL